MTAIDPELAELEYLELPFGEMPVTYRGLLDGTAEHSHRPGVHVGAVADSSHTRRRIAWCRE